MSKKIAILCGGKTAEHEVSLQSAKNIAAEIDKSKYEVIPIGITKKGEWLLYDDLNFLLNSDNPKKISLAASGEPVNLLFDGSRNLISLKDGKIITSIDAAFPVLHGTFGEDGTMQGLFEIAQVPYVGPNVLGSAIGMDKDITKRLLRDGGVDIADFFVFRNSEKEKINFVKIKNKLGLPFFVKPANAGSSVGVSKVKNKNDFVAAVEEAFRYDNKILIEEGIAGRELECAVLGNEEVKASIVGEVLPQKDFYSYEAKYIDTQGAILEMPAKITSEEEKRIQKLAIKTFKILGCEGMARVDFFLTQDGLVVNEINTIPGFTKISMYPKLWDLSGIKYPDLIDRLVRLGFERFEREKRKLENF